MKNQRLLTITLQRGTMRREQPRIQPIGEGGKFAGVGEKLTGWAINPTWINSGSTAVKDYRGWFDIEVFDVRSGQTSLQPSDCLPIPEPRPLPAAGTVQAGTSFLQLAKTLSFENAAGALAGTKYIFMRGRVQYRDIFPDTPQHYVDWCVGVIPNDLERSLFSFLSVRENAD